MLDRVESTGTTAFLPWTACTSPGIRDYLDYSLNIEYHLYAELKGVDLERYRGKAREEVRITTVSE